MKRSAPKRSAVQRGRAAPEKEFKQLEKIAAKYEKQMRRAWAQIGGPDENVIRSEVEKVAKLKDPAERKRQIDELSRRYAPLVQRACEVAGIDPGAVRQEILAAVPAPPGARVEH